MATQPASATALSRLAIDFNRASDTMLWTNQWRGGSLSGGAAQQRILQLGQGRLLPCERMMSLPTRFAR
jgi:hypothetical protein